MGEGATVADLGELFGEGTLKTLAIATAEDVKAHLAAGRPLRAAFSAAHCVNLAPKPPWARSDHDLMASVLREEVEDRLRSLDDVTAAWRAAYLRMLTGEDSWTDAERARMLRAMAPPASLRPWKRVWFAAQAADYLLLGGSPYWSANELDQMLQAVRDEFVLRIRNADKLMAAERVVLYKVLAASSPTL